MLARTRRLASCLAASGRCPWGPAGSHGAAPRARASSAPQHRSSGPGDDFIYGANGNHLVYGGLGDDRIMVPEPCIGIACPPRSDTDRNRVYGGPGNDTIVGAKHRDVLIGGSGDDKLRARDIWQDSVSGGGGYDRATWDRRDSVKSVETRLRW